MIRFHAPGVSHHGTYFESFMDIEEYLAAIASNCQDFTAKVYLAPNGEAIDYLGEYLVTMKSGKKRLVYTKTITTNIKEL
jgi:hypothetical protein